MGTILWSCTICAVATYSANSWVSFENAVSYQNKSKIENIIQNINRKTYNA